MNIRQRLSRATSVVVLTSSSLLASGSFFGGYLYPVGDSTQRPTASLPNANGYEITQLFNNDDGHTGVDLANGSSGGDVRAIANGRVVQRLDGINGWGYMVRVEHRLPSNEKVYSQYGHMAAGSLLVNLADEVYKG